MQALPAGVLRLKGWLRTPEFGWTELQFAGRRESLHAAAQLPTHAVVVAIGLKGQLPQVQLRAFLEAS
jgi:hypothetical protein